MKKVIVFINLIILTLLFSACETPELVKREFTISTMNTYVSGYIYVKPSESDKVVNNITAIYDELSELSDNYNAPSEGKKGIYYINRLIASSNEEEVTVNIDKKLYDLLDESLELMNETNRYFDITIGGIIDVWKSIIEGSLPGEIMTDEVINHAKEQARLIPVIEDPLTLTIVDNKYYVTVKKGVKIDLGAVAKGYATNKVKEYLESIDIEHYLISGGSSSIIGGVNQTRPTGMYILGLVNPLRHIFSETYGYAHIKNQSVTTSGSYEQFVTDKEGNWYHHIIDPNTKFPANRYHALSLIGADAGKLDAYSTALFAMSETEIAEFIENKNLEVVIFKKDGTKQVFNQNQIHLKGE